MALTPAAKKRQQLTVPVTEEDPAFRTNSDSGTNSGGVAGERLLSLIERIERLEEERRTIASDIKEVKSEAKGTGFDVRVINYLIKIRRQDKDDRDEFEALVEAYSRDIGMMP